MAEDHYKYRNELLRQYIYLALCTSVPLAPIEYFSGLPELALIVLIFACFMVPLIFLTRDSRRYNLNSRYFMIAISILFISGFICSFPETDNKYFLLLYPIASFSIRGVREGIVWSGAMLMVFATLYFAYPERHAGYSMIYFSVAFFMVGYVVYHYRYYEILNFKHIQQIQQHKDQVIKEQEIQARVLQELCDTDFLTSVNSRQKLDAVLQEEAVKSQNTGCEFSVILLDVDHFKQVNDSFGHQVGDQVLQNIAGILANNIRETDIVGRWGGEEFIVISRNNSLSGAVLLAEKLRSLIEAYDFPEVKHRTASFGVAGYQNTESIESLIERCDRAMYKAKTAGRNRVVEMI